MKPRPDAPTLPLDFGDDPAAVGAHDSAPDPTDDDFDRWAAGQADGYDDTDVEVEEIPAELLTSTEPESWRTPDLDRDALVARLNPEQAEAVRHRGPALLVVAGPGSGKTRVLTHRIADLVAEGIEPWRIMAVTFTNKAAAEMRDRLGTLVGSGAAERMWASTFHSMCVRFLRMEHEAAGLSRRFVIYDADDSARIVRSVLDDLGLKPDKATEARKLAKDYVSALSDAKNAMAPIVRLEARHGVIRLQEVLDAYQARLVQVGGCDFDDLLLRACQVLETNAEVRSRWANRFDHILVDEYQDTNGIQLRILHALLGAGTSLCAVGDLDQCHPAGTMIQTTNGPVAIEQLRVGVDRLASWRPADRVRGDDIFGLPTIGPNQGRIRGYEFHVAERHFEGEMITLTTERASVDVTPNHRVYTRWRPEVWEDPASTVLYLMRKGDCYRVGTAFLHRSNGAGPGTTGSIFGLSLRCRMEDADAAWVLDVMPATDARTLGPVIAANFGLPMTTFAPSGSPQADTRTQSAIDSIFDRIEDMPGKARRLLAEFGRDIDHPFWERGGKVAKGGSRYANLTAACNVIAGAMQVPVRNNNSIDYLPVEPTRRPFSGPVYSLNVEPFHNYVADEIVVGNCVYSWRGAQPEVVTRFVDDFADAQVVVLSENYRSTPEILDVCQAIIDPNPARFRPQLRTSNPNGAKVVGYEADSDRGEADWVADGITATPGPTSDHAVLVRTNAMTRPIEEAFARRAVPYVIVGALRFFERAEVRDALAWLKIATNPADIVAFDRTASAPRRGFGDKTAAIVHTYARTNDIAVAEAAEILTTDTTLPVRARSAVQGWVAARANVTVAVADGPVSALRAVLGPVGLVEHWAKDEAGEDRVANLNELVSAATDFVATDGVTADGRRIKDLTGDELTSAFLEHVALVSAADESTTAQVAVMTAHTAKGREFPHVWVVGLEENVFPHTRSLDEDAGIEEERRLLFVACSRAEQTLHLSWARTRFQWGRVEDRTPSRFIDDLPATVVWDVAPRRNWGSSNTSNWSGRANNSWGGSSTRKPTPARSAAPHTSAPSRFSSPSAAKPFVAEGPRLDATTVSAGDKVRHRLFGEGVIVAVHDTMVTVQFGPKERTLDTRLAPLESI